MTMLFGLAAALGWGIADLLARQAGRAVGVQRAMFFALLWGFVVMSGWIVLDWPAIARAAAGAGWAAWLAGLAAAPIMLIASSSLFRALAVGRLAIVSPITASYAVVTTVLSALSGEVLTGRTLLGIAVTVAGVALASTPAPKAGGARHGGPGLMRGTGWALLASACYGLGTWLQGALAVPALGFITPVWLYYAMGVAILVVFSRLRHQTLALPKGTRLSALSTGLSSVAAYTCFSAGLATGHVSVVTVLSTLSSGIAALLGRIVLAERLAAHQWLGVATILAGVALINAGR